MDVVDDRRSKEFRTNIEFADIPVGTTFLGCIGQYKGLFLKTFQSVVYLPDPSATWGGISLQVLNYQPVLTQVRILKDAD